MQGTGQAYKLLPFIPLRTYEYVHAVYSIRTYYIGALLDCPEENQSQITEREREKRNCRAHFCHCSASERTHF